MDNKRIVFQDVLQEAYEKGKNEAVSVQEIVKMISLRLKEMMEINNSFNN